MTTPTLTVQQLAAMPRVNLLPREIHERRNARRMQTLMGVAVAGAVVVVSALYVGAHHSVATAQSDLSSAQTLQTSLQSQINTYNHDVALRTEAAAKQSMLATGMSREIQWSHYLNDLTLRIPDNVWLTSVSVSETADATAAAPSVSTTVLPDPGYGSVTFEGVAFSHDDVAAWLNSLGKEKGYLNPYFTDSSEEFIGPRKAFTFTSTVQLTDKALSGRYNTPSGS